MKRTLLKHLACPTCESDFQLHVSEQQGDEIVTGRLTCASCSQQFPISGSIPRFVDADKYAGSFSVQRLYVRKHFHGYQKDRSGDRLFIPTTGFDEESVRTGLNLEVGCGYGRFLDVVDRLGGEVIGVDLSTHSIELARDFVGSRKNVHLVQCDLFEMPFRNGCFDNVYSIGVLHHTPDTKIAFQALVPLVTEEGRISIWVYHPHQKASSNRWRVITTRLPHRVLYAGCIMNQSLFTWIRALPGGWRFNSLIPGSAPKSGRTFWMRVLGDFDNLSPEYAFTHTPSEVTRWFEEAGLKEVAALDRLTSVIGTKST